MEPLKFSVLDGYAAAASPSFVAQYNSLSPERIYAQVIDLFPQHPSRVVDIGAGTGRDAAWLAGKGHDVLAIEPVQELRKAGQELHSSERIIWLDDQLPDLSQAYVHGRFDLVLVCAVWHHLSAEYRAHSMASLGKLVMPGGRLIMSLRHGVGAPDRPAFLVDPGAVIALAQSCGLQLQRRCEAASVQTQNQMAGVSWTWLVFQRIN